MSTYTEFREKTMKATADLTGKQYYIMGFDTTNENQCVIANAQTIPLLGVLKTEGIAAQAVNVVFTPPGTFKVILGGTVAAGDALTADSAGKAIKTVTNKDMLIGHAMQAGVSGDIIEYRIHTGILNV